MALSSRLYPLPQMAYLDLHAYQQAFTNRTKLVSVCYASNVLGTINPIQYLAEVAHSHGVPILVDAAQIIAHRPIDVQELRTDFGFQRTQGVWPHWHRSALW